MKLMINMSESLYNAINQDIYINGMRSGKTLLQKLVASIANGTPIPDNATNGEIMQMMFPNGVVVKFATFMRFVVSEDEYINCAYEWWNAPYQKGDKK